ncbi:MAG: hypothetical protein H7122_01160 [Chitinophagaceae bacterium]|nr:hypothetical protein [Chitinophagaceae bacterium]
MKRYIGIYGGTELTKNESAFIQDLSYTLLNETDFVLVTGGFQSSAELPVGAISTDHSVWLGAKKIISENKNFMLDERLETWLPDKRYDRKEEGVIRFSKGRLKELTGKSAQARRFILVRDVDALITIKGRKQTIMVLDFAFAINKPIFPLPFAGGDSSTYWNNDDNTAQIKKWFGIDDLFIEKLKIVSLDKLAATEKDQLIKKIIAALYEGIQRRCLILMAYDPEPDQFYLEVVKPAVEEMGYTAIRIDREANEGNILKIYGERLQDSDIILADITEANPNVMYELGMAHAQNFRTILFSRKKLEQDSRLQIPFYLTMDSIENSDATTEVGRKYLTERIKVHLAKKRE